MILLYILLILISIQSFNILSLIVSGIGIVVKLKYSSKFSILFILFSICAILLSSSGRLSGDYGSYLRIYKKAAARLYDLNMSGSVELISKLDEQYGESDFSNAAKAYASENAEDMMEYIKAIENKHSTLYYSAAINYFGKYGTAEELRNCAVDAAERYPDAAEFVECAGRAEFDLGNMLEAKYYLARADMLYDSKNGDIQALLGLCVYYETDTDTAQSYFESARILGVSADLNDIISNLNKE